MEWKGLSKMTENSLDIREKMDKYYFVKIQNFYLETAIINKAKSQITN